MSQNARILVVDDEPLNLEILSEYLDGTGYVIITAEQGAQAWDILQQSEQEFDLVVLDRMMPVMDGIELLTKIKAEPRFTQIPVILQTAAASKEQVAEGLQRGAYYYLVKPYEREALISIIRAALYERTRRLELRDLLKKHNTVATLLTQGEFSFRTLEEARQLAGFLAHLCPKPETAIIGLAELMINAVEHGNLEISYQDKSRLNEEGKWAEEVERRLQLPEYNQRWVHLSYFREAHCIRFEIEDEGHGFAPDNYLEIRPERAFDSHGRGIAMARMLSFSKLEYLEKGNKVKAEIEIEEKI